MFFNLEKYLLRYLQSSLFLMVYWLIGPLAFDFCILSSYAAYLFGFIFYCMCSSLTISISSSFCRTSSSLIANIVFITAGLNTLSSLLVDISQLSSSLRLRSMSISESTRLMIFLDPSLKSSFYSFGEQDLAVLKLQFLIICFSYSFNASYLLIW